MYWWGTNQRKTARLKGMVEVGERLKQFRDEIGYSQWGVAESVGMKQRTWAGWEKQPPQALLYLRQLSVTFGVSADYLLGLTDDGDRRKAEGPGAALPPQGEIAQLVTLAQRMSDELRYALLTVAEALGGVEDGPTPKEIAREMRAREIEK